MTLAGFLPAHRATFGKGLVMFIGLLLVPLFLFKGFFPPLLLKLKMAYLFFLSDDKGNACSL